MNKAEILRQINNCRASIRAAQNEVAQLEEKQVALQGLLATLDSHTDDFVARVGQMRYKGDSIDGMAQKVKAAKGYGSSISEALRGGKYTKATSRIEQFRADIVVALNRVASQMESRQSQLWSLRNRLSSLERSYNTCLEW
ncbi:MAG: hypothetical protein LBS58_05410 [Coriobacteriales bacterium]|jgi:prophage tail gpP-like protein|nr:hypothetical protein [Coriobacteriales bacterium]